MISWTMDRDKPSRYCVAEIIQRTEVDGMEEKEVLSPWLHDRVAMRADSQGERSGNSLAPSCRDAYCPDTEKMLTH